MLSFGRYRHLSQCSNPQGILTVLAIDHRANLVSEMQKHTTSPIAYADVAAFKRSVIRNLGGASTALLTDPDYGFPGVSDGSIPGRLGLIAPLEITDYAPHPSQRQTQFIRGWDMHKLKQAGCSGAKLLLYYHPEAPNVQQQKVIVQQVLEQCQKENIPLFLEPILYSLDTSRPLTNAERRQASVETVSYFSRQGVDVLKIEFPIDVQAEADEQVWQQALAEVNAACQVPWALLSAGVSFEIFLQQTVYACSAGASGVIVGRAVWAEAVKLHGEAREYFLRTTGRERMEKLAAICCGLATPWTIKHTAPSIGEQWYQ